MAEAKARKLEEARQAVAEAKLRAEQKEAAAQVRTPQHIQNKAETRQLTATRIHTIAHRRSWLHDAPQWRKRGHIGAKSSLNVSNAMGAGGACRGPSLVMKALTQLLLSCGRPQLHLPEEKPPVTLDDLFRKTKTEPAVYWLPVSAQRVERLRARGGITRPPQVRYVYD